jgi:hypothetical protein
MGAITSCWSRRINRSIGSDILAAFTELEADLSPLQIARREAEFDKAREIDKGHGRIEERSIEVTPPRCQST